MVDKFRTIDLQRETKDGKSEVYFSYDVGDDFRKNATELVLGYLIDNGLEPTKDNVQDAQSYVRDLFWRSHGPDVVQAYGKDVEAKLIEKYNIEQDNPKPPNDSEAPTGDLDKANQELMDYVKEDLGSSRKPGDKLFSNT
jgi:hypothetical protein